MDDKNLARDYRCPKCGRVNFRGYLGSGSFVRMRCYRDRCRAWLDVRPGYAVQIVAGPLEMQKQVDTETETVV